MSVEHDTESPNVGHYFELLDRVHVAEAYLATVLGDHPVLIKHPELNSHFEKATDALAELYRSVGQFDETWE